MAYEPKGYTFFDHTADVGVSAQGTTLEELFERVAKALTVLIAEDSIVQPAQERPIALSAENVEALLMGWLRELLFWFSTERFLPSAFDLDSVSETALRGRIKGERFDPARHTFGTEVKGITRHQFHVERADDRWEARVIFDV
jgi:SHS2 domain-containing protein